MAEEVVPAKRLLDNDEGKSFQLLEEWPIIQRIRGVGVHHQLDTRKILAQAAHRFQILPRLDFYLDALVPGREFSLHFGAEFVQGLFNADRNAASDLLANASNEF